MDASNEPLDVKSPFKRLKISATKERCQALRLALSRFTAKIQTSPATLHVISAIQFALTALESYLDGYAADPDLDLLEEDELENSLHFVSKVVPLIYNILGLIENADVASVPPEIISPIRREVHKLFPQAELIVVSDSSLNYSILDISGYVRDILRYLKTDLPPGFPEKIFRASIPSVEFDQALLHCILSHELGHPLYQLHDIRKKLLPIKIDEAKVQQFYKSLRSVKQGQEKPEDKSQQFEFPFDEIFFRGFVTARVEERISRWLQELSADPLMHTDTFVELLTLYIRRRFDEEIERGRISKRSSSEPCSSRATPQTQRDYLVQVLISLPPAICTYSGSITNSADRFR